MNAIQHHVSPQRLPKWTVLGAIDATASDLEHYELERVDQVERLDKRDANVVMEVRRDPQSNTTKKIKSGIMASLAPIFAGGGLLAATAVTLTGGPLLFAAGCLAFGALEGALLLPSSKKAFESFRYMGKQSAEPAWRGTREYVLGNDARPGIHSPVVKQSTSSKAPSGQQLGTFLADNMKKFPAQRYAAIVAGHGRAMSTIGDMPVAEVAKATRVAHEQTGRKLDVLVLDSCLVGNFETLLPMADHVRYAVVSQEPVYTSVIDWAGVIDDAQSGTPSAQLFTSQALNRAERNPWHQTLSTVRMSQMGKLRSAVENLGAAVQQSARNGHRADVRKSFASATKVQDGDWMSRTVEQKLDLGNVIGHLYHQTYDPALRQAAGEAWEAYQKAVVDHRKSEKFDTTTGLSIQGPRPFHSVDGYAEKTNLPEWSKALGQMRPWPMRMIGSAVGAVKNLFR